MSEAITMTFAPTEAADITKALRIAMYDERGNHHAAFNALTDEQKQAFFNAEFYWRRQQPDYDALAGFKRDCVKWGCD